MPVTVSPNGIIFTNHQPAYTWNASNGATSYRLIVNSTSPASEVLNEIVPSTVCSNGVCRYRPAEALQVGSYEFKVSAIDAGPSEYSPWRPFTVMDAAATIYLPVIHK